MSNREKEKQIMIKKSLFLDILKFVWLINDEIEGNEYLEELRQNIRQEMEAKLDKVVLHNEYTEQMRKRHENQE